MRSRRTAVSIWTLAGFLLPAGALVYLFIWALVGERLSPRTEINRAAITMEQRALEELRLEADEVVAASERWFKRFRTTEEYGAADDPLISDGIPFWFDIESVPSQPGKGVVSHLPARAVERNVLLLPGSDSERNLYVALHDDFERQEFIVKDMAAAERVLDSMRAERFGAPAFRMRTLLARAAFLKRQGRFDEVRDQLVDLALSTDMAAVPGLGEYPFALQAYLLLEDFTPAGDRSLEAVGARILPAMEKGTLPLSAPGLHAVAARLRSIPRAVRERLGRRARTVEILDRLEKDPGRILALKGTERFAFVADRILWIADHSRSDARGFAFDADDRLDRLLDRDALESEITGLSVVLEQETDVQVGIATDGTLRILTAPAGIEGTRLKVVLLDRVPFEENVATRRAYVFGTGGCLLVALVVLGFATFRAVRREVAAARARSEFMASVSHELRTPLASIRTFAELLEEGRVSDDATRHRFTRLIVSNCRRLSAMIENVLDLRRSEEGGLRFAIDEVDLNGLLGDLFRDIRAVAEEEGFAMTVEIAPGLPVVRADAMALARAIYNICDNARKYGGEQKAIAVHAAAAGGRVRVTISDRGPGIPAAEREKVFERFQRGQGGMTAPSGVGLGLSLAREAIEACGGRLSLESAEGEGSTFIIELPGVDESDDE